MNVSLENKKTALICGISGQDGAYLAKLLIDNGYRVIGTSRDADINKFEILERCGIKEKIELCSMAIGDFRSVLQVIKRYLPNEIYNLAGQSSVGLSFNQPVETIESITTGTLNILEAIRFINPLIRFYNAGSGETFGDTGLLRADEKMAFNPRSPYAVAKVAAYHLISTYRQAYGLFCCTGLLFNHESPLRPERFVTQKIIQGVKRIHLGSNQKIVLGNLDISRDWGWAPEYVDSMHKMLQLKNPEDFVIATGVTHTLEEFVKIAFDTFNMDWKKSVIVDKSLFRPLDIKRSAANPERARDKLCWNAVFSLNDVVAAMISEDHYYLNSGKIKTIDG